MRRIGAALRRIRPRYLPQSAMGKAITHTLDQWPALDRFLTDGRIEIDNNLVENAIRPTAIGRKNWLFIGAAQAGQRAAILYTIVQTCRRWGLDPMAYLRDVLTRLPALHPRGHPRGMGQGLQAAPRLEGRCISWIAIRLRNPHLRHRSPAACPLKNHGATHDAYFAFI